MSGFVAINEELDRVSKDIETLTYELDIAREAFLLKRAEYENAFAKIQLETKARDPDVTQTDLKAIATCDTYGLEIEVIKKDSAYRKAQNKLKALRDRQAAMQEVSYNLRREAGIH